MDFNRQNQRRRKLALDQKQQDAALDTETTPCANQESAQSHSNQYNAGARRSRQLKTTDLIPKRPLAIAAMIAALAIVIGILNVLHYNAASWEAALEAPSLQVLQMSSDNSLVSWYANLLLLLTCGASLQVYLLRQHRRDDYRGTYRVWLWLALLFVMASMVSTSGLYSLVELGLDRIVASRLTMSLVTVMLIVKLVGLTLLTARAVYEVRYSKAAVVALTVVFIALGTAAMMDNPKIHTLVSDNLQAAHSNLVVIGVSALLTAVLLYARLVYFQAHRIVASENLDLESKTSKKTVGKKKASQKSATRSATSSKKSTAATRKAKPVDPDVDTSDSQLGETKRKTSKKKAASKTDDKQATPRAKSKKKKSVRKSKPLEDFDIDKFEDFDEQKESMEGLSKSERRRQRKLQRRMKRAA